MTAKQDCAKQHIRVEKTLLSGFNRVSTDKIQVTVRKFSSHVCGSNLGIFDETSRPFYVLMVTRWGVFARNFPAMFVVSKRGIMTSRDIFQLCVW